MEYRRLYNVCVDRICKCTCLLCTLPRTREMNCPRWRAHGIVAVFLAAGLTYMGLVQTQGKVLCFSHCPSCPASMLTAVAYSCW
jgi:hypothetical protein